MVSGKVSAERVGSAPKDRDPPSADSWNCPDVFKIKNPSPLQFEGTEDSGTDQFML